jgi:hypothetical protein
MNERTEEIFKDGIHPREKPKKNLLVPVLIIVILIVAIGSIIFIFSSSKERVTGLQTLDVPKQEMQTNILQKIKEKPPVETDTKAKLGLLEISIVNITEGSYTEWDPETLSTFNKSYFKIYVKLFNPTWEGADTIDSIKLVDELNNEYLPDNNPNKFIPLRELGKDWRIYSRISKEGYLFFTDVNENFPKYDLIFSIQSADEIKRAIYSFEMIR